METLKINSSKTTFGINTDLENGILEITGTSYPDNAIDFYMPVLDWVKEFTETQNRPLEVIFKVNYYNTSSSKYLFKMLEMLEGYHVKGNVVNVIWHYYDGEEDMLEAWRELIDELNLPFQVEID